MEKQRLEYVDIMKGLGIILVVMQHGDLFPGPPEGRFENMVLSSHMPMFFFVAGLFFPYKKSFAEMVRRSWHRLVVPWIVFISLSLLLLDALCAHDLSAIVNRVVDSANPPMWFLRSMTVGVAVSWALAVWCHTRAQRFIVMLLLTLLTLIAFPLSSYLVHTLPPKVLLYMVTAPTLTETCALLSFMWGGHMVVCEFAASRLAISRKRAAAVILFLIPLAYLLDPAPDMRWFHTESVENPFIIWASAWVGIGLFWAVACLLQGFKPLAWIGSCSLMVLGLHYMPLRVCDIFLGNTHAQSAWYSVAFSVLVVVATLLWRRYRKNS